MTAINSTHSLVLHTIQHVSSDRLQRAVCNLVEGNFTVSLTRQTATEIHALVKNDGGGEYGVTLTETLTTCSCKDALYRGVICKHAVATALHVLRTPPPKEQPAKLCPTIHLMWRDGVVLCEEPLPARVKVWPWTDYLLTWPETCSACVVTYKHPKTEPAAAA